MTATGDQPFSYSWETSTDGAAYIPVLGEHNNSLTLTNMPNATVDIRSTVTNDGGSDTKTIARFSPVSLPVQTGDVAVYFSDLPDGNCQGWGEDNKGAAITVWGSGLGTDVSALSITVCDQPVREADIVELVTGAPIPWLQSVTFHLNDSMTADSGDIVITVDGTASNPIPFTIREG